MIANTIFAAGAFASLVAAIPLAQPRVAKRDIVYATQTKVVYTTVAATTTHWLAPGETPPTEVAAENAADKPHFGRKGHNFGHGRVNGTPVKPGPQPNATPGPGQELPPFSPENTPQPPAADSYEEPARRQQAPPPAQEPAQQAPPPPAPEPYQGAPTPAPAPPAPEPEQQAPPPPVPESYQEVAPPAPKPAPEAPPSAYEPASNGGGSGGSSSNNGLSGSAEAGSSHSGDLTYYAPGMGACGETSSADENVVAISHTLFDEYNTGNTNNNPLCGMSLTITGADGSPYSAKVVDRCHGCSHWDLDVPEALFNKVAPQGDGRVPGMKWSFD